AVADLVVDRGADGAGEGRVARRGIADGGRLDLQLVGQVLETEAIELAGGHPGFHIGGDEIEDARRILAGGPHLDDVVRGLDRDAHVLYQFVIPAKVPAHPGWGAGRCLSSLPEK